MLLVWTALYLSGTASPFALPLPPPTGSPLCSSLPSARASPHPLSEQASSSQCYFAFISAGDSLVLLRQKAGAEQLVAPIGGICDPSAPVFQVRFSQGTGRLLPWQFTASPPHSLQILSLCKLPFALSHPPLEKSVALPGTLSPLCRAGQGKDQNKGTWPQIIDHQGDFGLE